MMNSSMLKKEIMEMRQQMMKVKDSLKWMEERSAMLQEHWEGEAGTTWVNTFMEWLRMDTEHVTAMQEILDRAEQMGILLAAVNICGRKLHCSAKNVSRLLRSIRKRWNGLWHLP